MITDPAFAIIFWLTVTVLVFEAADLVSRKSNRHPLAHPVLWATPVLILTLVLTETSYEAYYSSTALLSFLLGPAVVGLAVPIWARRTLIARLAVPLLLALVAGSITSIATVWIVLTLFGLSPDILTSILPRSATTPVAMEIALQIGGIPALAAVGVLSSGVFGAMVASPLLNLLGLKDYRVRGFAVGVSSHGIGAARAFQVNATAGAFASLGMALNAVMTAVLLSLYALLW